MLYRISFIILIAFSCISCQKEKSAIVESGFTKYDIFPIIGQSNAYFGRETGSQPANTDSRIKQLGRFGDNSYKIIPAKDPLEHFTIVQGRISFAMTFAHYYLREYLQPERGVLLIPGALEGSSFTGSQWRKGDSLYNDIVRRVKYVLEKYPGSEVKAFLWHQGESDIMWGRYYAELLDKMITDMRMEIAGTKGDSIPFILGGLVPYWVDQQSNRKTTDSVIAETSKRLPFIGYANAREPFIIKKTDDTVDEIHFNASGQRELGKRYFKAYKETRK
ncbi:sialate O-acetylesterase [Lacibacter sp. H375]|uniref:sialate O-acetylesterase n=1 Tax=Lacibacter sp. H375 TaxID=3133424 RepID=UPI0030BF074C